MRFSPRTLPELPELDFSAQYGREVENTGSYVHDTEDYSIDARWPGAFMFFRLSVVGGRVSDACFGFQLTPDEMRKAVALLRKAGGGLERWIVPGLEYTQRHAGFTPPRVAGAGFAGGGP